MTAHPQQGGIVSRNRDSMQAATHGPGASPSGRPGGPAEKTLANREAPGANRQAPGTDHEAGGQRPEEERRNPGAHGPGEAADHTRGPDHADHRPAAVKVTRDHAGRLALVAGAAGAGGLLAHHADRAFLHADAHGGQQRDHAAVDRDRDFVKAHARDYRFADVRRFDAHDLYRWRAGVWRNEWHYGRRGWWWETDGVWYPYADPIYPYPLTVAALVAYDTAFTDGADLEAAETGAAGPDGTEAPIPPLPAAPPGWYRCGTPNGYFPYVGYCSVDWALVQDAPPQLN